MKIIILGAGQVGTTLAANLVSEDNDITLVDNESQHLQNLQDKHDLRVVKGSPSSPKILRDAGAADADLMVAVTASDETNMIACQLGYTLFNTPIRIARIRNAEYLREKDKLFNDENVPIDHLISPENLVTDEITRLIAYPGALQVAYFANNRISIVIVKAYYGGPLVGYALSAFKEHIKAVMSELQRLEKTYKRIMIVGSGNIASGVAKQLEDKYQVKLIERDGEKAKVLAERLSKTLVFHGDASDQNLLFEEHIESVDVFLSLSADDEANIMSALLAKRLGAKKAMVLIQRMAYINLIQGGTIDIAVSPQQATISALLGHVRKGDIKSVASLRHGTAEAIELVVHGDATTSNVVGRQIGDIKLPVGAMIAAILRKNEVIITRRQVVIEEGDNVIVYINDKKSVSEIEKLFQPSAFFI